MSRQPKRDPKKRFGHPFIMGYHKEDGKLVADKGPSVARIPHHMMPEVVELDLTAADVLSAHRKKGEGDTRFCAVAMLIRRQKNKFTPLNVNGVVEFMDSRALVGIGRPGSYPERYLHFYHSCSWLTQMFDRKGYKKLLQKIEDNGGSLTITLRRFRLRLKESSPGKKASPTDGTRSRVHSLNRGEHRRSMRLNNRSIQQVERLAVANEA